MSQKHLNRSLSQTRTVEIIASVKWTIRVKTYFLSKKGTKKMCSLKGVSGCRFYKQKKELVLHE